jgi:hypothetical protein
MKFTIWIALPVHALLWGQFIKKITQQMYLAKDYQLFKLG